MRLDHTLYLTAAIVFMMSGVLFSYQMAYKETLAASIIILGFLFLGLGYLQRPKRQIISKTVETSTSHPQILSPPQLTEVKQEPLTTVNNGDASHQENINKSSSTTPSLTDIKGIGKKRAEILRSMGITNVESLAKASAEDIAAKLKVSVKTASTWIETAKKLVENM